MHRHWPRGGSANLKVAQLRQEADMWTRRVLLATMVAAAAMSLRGHLTASANSQMSVQTVAASSFR
jgi:hypothetical protein